jgi:hypothetical protein
VVYIDVPLFCRHSRGPSTPQPHSSPLAALGPLSLSLGPLSFPTVVAVVTYSVQAPSTLGYVSSCCPSTPPFPGIWALAAVHTTLTSRNAAPCVHDHPRPPDKVPVFPPPARSAPGPRPPGPRRHRPARGDSSHGLVPPQRPARPRRMPPGARLALPTATDPVGLGFGRASCRLQPVSRTLSVRPPPPRGARRHCWNQAHLSALALSRRTPSP